MLGWKNDATYGTADTDANAGNNALAQVFRAYMHIKRLCKDYEQFRRNVSNENVDCSREQAQNGSEAHRQMEHYHPFYFLKKKPDDGTYAHHLINGAGSDKKFQCFKCRQLKPSCDRAKNFKFVKKEDGFDVNS